MSDAPLQQAYLTILDSTPGEHCTREGLKETPQRAAKAWRELTSGYDVDLGALLKTFDSDGYDEMVVVDRVPFASLCEHHLLPFSGHASVVYVPEGRIVGLSKIPRLIDALSHRLQVQERLTVQIADTLMDRLNPAGVMVVIEAAHLCCTLRGVKKPGTIMRTSAVRGVLKTQPETRSEALRLIGR